LRESSEPEAGLGLCVSGDGYRAMLFQVGSIWRLYESGLLEGATRISSISGGSITTGLLGLKWSRLADDPAAGRRDFVREVWDRSAASPILLSMYRGCSATLSCLAASPSASRTAYAEQLPSERFDCPAGLPEPADWLPEHDQLRLQLYEITL
jgi:Lysophospholipase catalytic domain